MIGQRTAVIGTPAAAPRSARRLRLPLYRTPALSGREILGSLLGQAQWLQLMLAMALISVAALIYLNQASKVAVLQFSIADLQRQQISLRMERANLYANATSLQSLQRVETVATGNLHMAPPALGSIVWLRPYVPVVTPPPSDAVPAGAEQASQPLTWMHHTLSFLASLL